MEVYNMKFNYLEIPPQWKHYWTKYPEGYTLLEALFNWVGQVNEMTDNLNNTNIRLDDFLKQFDTNLHNELAKLLQELLDNGEIEALIKDLVRLNYSYSQNLLDDLTTMNGSGL